MGKYKRKTKRASYTKEALRDAVREVESGRMSGYGASNTYQIPRMTIMDHVNRKRVTSTTLGRSTALTPEIEYKLAKSLHTMEKYGFGLSRKEVLEMVGDYVNRNKLITPFKNGIPGKDWFLAFKERHGLSLKKPQGVEHARKKAIDPFIVYPYFDLLDKTICDLNIKDKPSAIWNLDETSFSKDPAKTKVVGVKGHAATREISSPGRDNTTVLLGASASGEKMPPLIIFKGKNLWDTWTSPNAYPGTSYAATKNGWMETDVFETFFKKTFLPLVKDQRPVLLIYDGHSTHVGLNIMEEARKEKITILKLPPHSSHILQPLDVAVMKAFKDRWDPLLVKWQRLNVGSVLPKSEFSRLIGQVWSEINPQVLRNGFRKAGIYPVNREEVKEDKFDMLKLRHWKEFEDRRHISTEEQQIARQHVSSEEPEITKRPVSTEEQVITKRNPKTLVTIVFDFMKKTLNHDIPQESHNMIMNQSSEMSAQDPNVSFEELLLNKLKLSDNSPKPKRRKVAPGAEIITHDDVIEKKREERNKNLKLNANKKKEKKEEQNKDLKSNAMKKKEIKKDEPNKKLSSLANIKKEREKQEQIITLNSNSSKKLAKDYLQRQESDPKKIKVISNVLIKKADSKSLKEKKENDIYKNPKPKSTEMSKIRLKHRHSSTSVSGSISSHSDSDIAYIESDITLTDEDDEIINRAILEEPNKKKEKGKEQNKHLKSNAMKKKEIQKDEQNKKLSSLANVKKEKKTTTLNSNTNKKLAKEDVVPLRHVSKYRSEMQTFVAKDISNLPHCLQRQESDPKKIKVISNVLIKKADSESLKEKKENDIYKNPKPGSSGSGLSKIPLKHRHSSTSVSGSISSHSDSDIAYIESDITLTDEDDEIINRAILEEPNKKKEKGKEQNKDLKSNAMKKKEIQKDEQNKKLSSLANVKKEKKTTTLNSNTNKKLAKEDVVPLRHVSKYRSEMQTFVAKDISNLPHCLQRQESDPKKINVISNVLIKKADSESLKEKKENDIYKNPKPGSSGSGLSKIPLKCHHSPTCVSGSDVVDIESDTTLINEDENNSKLPQILNKENVAGNKENQNLSYNAGDNVLVRYHVRQKWTYYVGIIEDNKLIDEELCYSIKFYKTLKKPKLTFKMTKRIDRDDVPEMQIVKKIDLIRNPESLNAYSMSSKENDIFFIN